MRKNKLFYVIFAIFLLFPGLLLCSCGKKHNINIMLSGGLEEEYISSISLNKVENSQSIQYRESVTVSQQYQFEIVYKNGYDISDIYINGTDKDVEVKKVKGEDTWWKIVVIFTPTQDKTYNLIITEPQKMIKNVGVEVNKSQLENSARDLAEEIKIFACHNDENDFYPLSNFTGENSNQYKIVFDLTEKIAKFQIKMPNMFTNTALSTFASIDETYFTCKQDADDVCLYTFSINLNSNNYMLFESNIKLNFEILQDEANYIVFEINSVFESDESAYKFQIVSANEEDGDFTTNLKKTFGRAKTYKVKLDRTHSSPEELEKLNMLDLYKVKVYIGNKTVEADYDDIDDTLTFTLQNYDLPFDYEINDNKFNFSVGNLQLKNGYYSYIVQTERNFNNSLKFDDVSLNEFKFDIVNDVKNLQYATNITPKNKIQFSSNYNLLTSIYSKINLSLTFMNNNYTINEIDILSLLNSEENIQFDEDVVASESIEGVTTTFIYNSEDKKIYIDAVYEGNQCSRFSSVKLELSGKKINFTLAFTSTDFQTSSWEYADSVSLGGIVDNKVNVYASNQEKIDFSILTTLNNASWGNEYTWGMKISYFCGENEVSPKSAIITDRGGSMSQTDEGIMVTKKLTMTNGYYYIQNSEGQYEILTKIVCDFVKNL